MAGTLDSRDNNRTDKITQMKLRDIDRQQFRIPGVEGIWWNGGPAMTEEEHPQAGYVVISLSGKGNHWYPNDTEVELIDEEYNMMKTHDLLEQQAIDDIKVAGLCQKEDMWMSYEDSQELQKRKDEMTEKVLSGEVPYKGYPDIEKWAEEELAKVKMSSEDEKKQFIERMIGIPVPSSFTGTTEEYIQYVERVKKEGLNSDQQDKSPYEEYADAIAERRIVQEYEQWIDKIIEIKNPAQDMLNSPNKGVQYIAGIDPIHREEGKPAEVYVFRNPPEPGQEYTIDQLNDKNIGEWRNTDKRARMELEAKILQIAEWLKMLDKNLDMEISSNVKMCKDITGADYIPIMHGTKLMIQDMYNKLDITTKIQGEI